MLPSKYFSLKGAADLDGLGCYKKSRRGSIKIKKDNNNNNNKREMRDDHVNSGWRRGISSKKGKRRGADIFLDPATRRSNVRSSSSGPLLRRSSPIGPLHQSSRVQRSSLLSRRSPLADRRSFLR